MIIKTDFGNMCSYIWNRTCIRYSTIEPKEAAVLDITGFLFRLSINAKKEARYIRYG